MHFKDRHFAVPGQLRPKFCAQYAPNDLRMNDGHPSQLRHQAAHDIRAPYARGLTANRAYF